MKFFFPFLILILSIGYSAIPQEINDNHFDSSSATENKKDSSDWYSFYSSCGAVALIMPGEPGYHRYQVLNPEEPEGDPYIVHLYEYDDVVNGISYFFRYNDFPKGYAVYSDEEFFISMEENFSNDLQTDPSSVDVISKDGYPGREYYFYNVQKRNFVKAQLYLRGNRSYLFMAQMDMLNLDTVSCDRFFNSFRFEDFDNSDLTSYTNSKIGLSVLLPSNPVVEVDTFVNSIYSDLDYSYSITSTDTNTGVAYFVICDVYPEYYRVKDIDTLLNAVTESFFELGDSIVSQKNVEYKGFYGREIVMQAYWVHTYLKTRFIARGNYLYQIYAYLPEEYLNNKAPELFFNSMEFLDLDNVIDLYADKSDKVFADLLSEDSVKQFKAYKALDYYPFDNHDLQKIYKAIRKNYSSDTIVNTDIKNMLLYLLEYVHDESTVEFVYDVYNEFSEDYVKQLLLLEILSVMQTEKSCNLLVERLQNPPKAREYFELYNLFEPFQDSLELFAVLYPKLTDLFKIPFYDSHMAELTNALIDSGIVDSTFLVAYHDYYLGSFLNLIEGFKKMDEIIDEDYDNTLSTIMSFLYILERISADPKLTEELYRIIDQDNMTLKLQAALMLEKSGLFVPSKTWRRLLASDYSVFETLAGLHDLGKLQKYAKKYNSQLKIATIDMETWLLNFDNPVKIKFIGEKIITYNSSKARLYIYRVIDKIERTSYLAISGPQPIDYSELNFETHLTDVYFYEFNENNLQVLFELLDEEYSD